MGFARYVNLAKALPRPHIGPGGHGGVPRFLTGRSEPADLLAIYLNDHLAGAAAGLALARRAAANNAGTTLGDDLDLIALQIEEDRAALQRIMSDLGAAVDPVKQAGAVVGERVMRLKLNGQLTGYSPLSRLVELEALFLGVTGKRSLWRSLVAVRDAQPVLQRHDLDGLLARAERHREVIEAHRVEAAQAAFV